MSWVEMTLSTKDTYTSNLRHVRDELSRMKNFWNIFARFSSHMLATMPYHVGNPIGCIETFDYYCYHYGHFLWPKIFDNMTLFFRIYYFIWPNKNISFWNAFLVLPCCSMLFNKKALFVLNNATAHLAIEFLIRCSCKFLKIFSNRLDLCSTGLFYLWHCDFCF